MTGTPRRRKNGPPARPPAARPAYKPVPTSDPRRVAYELLRAVAERSAYANLTLPGLLRQRGVLDRDRPLATELGYGTLRAQGALDPILAVAAGRAVTELDAPVLDLLRLGAYQLLRTRVPAHAAVDQSVALARTVLTHGQVGLVNAVLRRVSERGEQAWLAEVAPSFEADPVAHLAQKYAHPAWIVRAYRDALGDWDETALALAADDARPRTHLVARPGRIDRDELLALSGGEPGPWSPYAIRMDGGDPGALDAVRDGRAGVQDEGSQLAALALADAPLDGPDATWLDLCAGPGGKAALLGALAVGRGARVVAVESQPHRAELVRSTTAGLPVQVVVADGREPVAGLEGGGVKGGGLDGGADRVLVDAPCTGLGALRRRPEARWRRTPADVAPLTQLQRELLTAGLAAARPGGVVAYVTCSPHLAETRAVLATVVRRSGAEPIDVRTVLPAVEALGDGPAVQMWPHRQGTDAMFIALLRAP